MDSDVTRARFSLLRRLVVGRRFGRRRGVPKRRRASAMTHTRFFFARLVRFFVS